MQSSSPASKVFLVIMAIAGWFALIAQLYINLTSGVAAMGELIIRYFSYFTILTNLIVAICCTSLLIGNKDFFAKQNTITPIAVYILVVGIVYNVILRFLWQPQGLQRIVDELLHSVIPLLFFLYWWLFVKKNELKYGNIPKWLIYPFIYSIFILIRGSISGFYPYPFIDMDKIGLNKTLINVVLLTAGFFFLSLVFVALGKFMSRKRLYELK
ncbi:MAG: Pr6Pr family membrane protein [Bacteroidota bacterium]